VRELMRHVPVHSYGRSLRNRMLASDDGPATKRATLARYPFTLAFENSVADDYVTEKFFDPLVAGSVPVYMGTAAVRDFAPGEHCYLDVRDFAGPAALAARLRELVADPVAYRRYLAWKERPLRSAFNAMVAHTLAHPFARLADLWRTTVTQAPPAAAAPA
jgi:hypothetical protein